MARAPAAHRTEDGRAGEGTRWRTALERHPAVMRLAACGDRRRASVEDAARELGIGASILYRLPARLRGKGTVESIVARKRGWRTGRGRLAPAVEAVVEDAIRAFYLRRPPPGAAELCREVKARCAKAGLPAPAAATVRRRVKRLGRRLAARARDGERAAEALSARAGAYAVERPNAVWQIDHSLADVVVVDAAARRPIGRPWLTFVVDVASRLVAGVHVSLEAPSAVSVGMAVRHAVLPKAQALAERGIVADWPGCGLPDAFHTDNGSDFRSAAFARACANFGVERIVRPVRRPRYGGHVERLIGTAQAALRLLPGTTFSAPAARDGYDSDGRAAMTLDEVETWLWRFIAADHNARVHSATMLPPLHAWRCGAGAGAWTPRQPTDPECLAVEFLPAVARSVGRQGITLNRIRYYEPSLGALFEAGPTRLLVHYDSRDMSRIFVRGPSGFQAIRYRNLANPPASLSELRAARRMLAAEGRAAVDEAAIMEARERNARLVAESAALTRRQRRSAGRGRRGMDGAPGPGFAARPSPEPAPAPEGRCADTGAIEQWWPPPCPATRPPPTGSASSCATAGWATRRARPRSGGWASCCGARGARACRRC